ncbi:C-type lectin domain family 4 member M-like isoform X1 [Erpetoichthys calabaricus]|uniref:C-type lectin domain family 4 member M-like n=1 Tax=Erpetoichthys calabaricus TaxID=27687 RepID=A0A8C4SC32_ERPCA|nr:C-type lectin domain family 4 member M-like isoform X1 [Erpetoichthys calabaricus]
MDPQQLFQKEMWEKQSESSILMSELSASDNIHKCNIEPQSGNTEKLRKGKEWHSSMLPYCLLGIGILLVLMSIGILSVLYKLKALHEKETNNMQGMQDKQLPLKSFQSTADLSEGLQILKEVKLTQEIIKTIGDTIQTSHQSVHKQGLKFAQDLTNTQELVQNLIALQKQAETSTISIQRDLQALTHTEIQVLRSVERMEFALQNLSIQIMESELSDNEQVLHLFEEIKLTKATAENLSVALEATQEEGSTILQGLKSAQHEIQNLSLSLDSHTRDITDQEWLLVQDIKQIDYAIQALGVQLKEYLINDTEQGLQLLQEIKNVKETTENISLSQVDLQDQDQVLKAAQNQTDMLHMVLSILFKVAGLDSCPTNFQHFKDSCYHFSTETKQWQEAQTFCSTLKSHLLVINDANEQNYVKTTAKGEVFWIGLHDSVNEGAFQWVDGTDFTNVDKFWDENQPDNWKDGEDCINISSSGKWNDNICTSKLKFICEMKKKSLDDWIQEQMEAINLKRHSKLTRQQ